MAKCPDCGFELKKIQILYVKVYCANCNFFSYDKELIKNTEV